MRTTVLFRVDAGPVVGLGHLQRCLSLAGALRRLEVASVFLVNRTPATQQRVERFGYEARMISQSRSWDAADLSETIALAAVQRCPVVIVDSDHEGERYLRQLRDAGFFVCALEDLAPHPFPSQLVVNGDAHARELPYVSSTGETVFLLGPEYSMLREEFWSIPQRVVREIPQRVLIMLGGDDPYRLMPDILRVVDACQGHFTIAAVIGPFFTHVQEIEATAARLAHPVQLIHAPEAVRDLMLEADVALSAGGQTLYELARVGCPTIAVRTAANQDGQVRVFAQQGFLQAVGWAGDRAVIRLMQEALRCLLSDPQARAAMSAIGQRLIDGQGALRVAQALATRQEGLLV
ncbi:MAG TPA: UDP-2,4-diacetamido-2,4,6-trideoxy-beta-L-altropyranose hydrolase [Candidatus Omnitrophica bacterium]|nr:UDP-2,4-diacetamido-2,4,6-trideoxy-beta-L-altropyranose hydrolase [Candidatus Omnitrophota bacterium]